MKNTPKVLKILLIIPVVFLLLEFVNGRSDFWDFRVYYDAAREVINGNSPYGKSFGLSSGYYKYAPVSLLLFIPFAIFPFTIASILFYTLITISFGVLMMKIHQFLKIYIPSKSKKEYFPFLISSLIVSAHLIRELHLGNVNLMLLLLFFLAFNFINNNKELFGGFLITVGIFIKPHFVILLPLLVLKSKWKSIVSVIVSSGFLIFLPVLFLGFDGNKELLNEWFEIMASHNADLVTSPNTIYGLISHYVLGVFGIIPTSGIVVVLLGIVALGILFLVVYNKYKFTYRESSLKDYLEYFLLIALIPNLTHTDTEHFLWSLPLIMLLVYLIFSIKNIQRRVWLAILILIFTFPWYLNSPDILPSNIINFLNSGGFLGLSNLIIIGMTLYLFYSTNKSHRNIKMS